MNYFYKSRNDIFNGDKVFEFNDNLELISL